MAIKNNKKIAREDLLRDASLCNDFIDENSTFIYAFAHERRRRCFRACKYA